MPLGGDFRRVSQRAYLVEEISKEVCGIKFPGSTLSKIANLEVPPLNTLERLRRCSISTDG
jgi:hypothetical protein